jgi:hypothetical protein
MTPEQSKAQVLAATREIIRVLGLKGVSASFTCESCNDQAEAPFRGVVRLNYDHAPTLEASEAEVQRMVSVLSRHGWSHRGDFHSHAPNVSKHDVTAEFGIYSPVQDAGGDIEIFGECGDMTTQKNTLPEPILADRLVRKHTGRR